MTIMNCRSYFINDLRSHDNIPAANSKIVKFGVLSYYMFGCHGL